MVLCQSEQTVRLAKCNRNFWDNSLGSKSNATDYFEDVILANLDREAWAAPNRAASPRENRPLVIAIDELNQLFAYPTLPVNFSNFCELGLSELKKTMQTLILGTSCDW
jgi:hypothetical protein